MSSCLIIQDQNNYYIGADTACSVNINGKYYRHKDNVEKIFTHGDDVYFCAGNMTAVNFITSWIANMFYQENKINAEQLSKMLKAYYPYLDQNVFDTEIVICRKENSVAKVYQLSQYNNYEVIIHDPKNNGVNLLCCGYKTEDLYNISKSMLSRGNIDVKKLYQTVFSSICDNKVGGSVTLYHNNNLVMRQKLYEDNVEYLCGSNTLHLLLADAVVAGHIEGSTIKGGTIQIGERLDGSYNFAVDKDGCITMIGGKGVSSSGEVIDLDDYNTTIELTANSTILNTNISAITLTCKIYSYGVDVTDSYKNQPVFQWMRATNNTEDDTIWNNAQNNSAISNTIQITSKDVSDIAFFQCQVNLPTMTKLSSSVAITVENPNVNIFTSKPDNKMLDGYCYHIGDLWVVGSDYQPSGYSQNTILVSAVNRASYSDADWVESAYYSKTFKDLDSRTEKLEQHVIIDSEGLHLRASSQDDVTFESLLTSDELSFGTWRGNKHNKVVWLGTDDMSARNVTIENYITIKEKDNDQPYFKLGAFIFQVEDNGSLSIM